MSGFNGVQGGMPQGIGMQQQPMQFGANMGRPVSAGQGFAAPMPRANTQAFRGVAGLLGMPNHLQSGAMTTAQFMQNQQSMQNPPSFGQGLPQGSGSQFAFEGGGA